MSKSDTDPDQPAYQTARVRILGGHGEKRLHATPSPERMAVPVTPLGEYTQANWEAESFALFAEGGNPRRCPECGRTAFYGPRFIPPSSKVRSCRFCGFWQEVGGHPTQHLPTVHSCSKWPETSRAPYIWWVAPDTESYPCPFCDDTVQVALSLVPVPREDPDHPWWRIPQDRTQSFYQRLWKNWEASSGRTIL